MRQQFDTGPYRRASAWGQASGAGQECKVIADGGQFCAESRRVARPAVGAAAR